MQSRDPEVKRRLKSEAIRIRRLLKLTSRVTALNRLKRGVFAVRHELAAAAVGTGMLLYVSAVALYYAERDVQPDYLRLHPGRAVVVRYHFDDGRIRRRDPSNTGRTGAHGNRRPARDWRCRRS